MFENLVVTGSIEANKEQGVGCFNLKALMSEDSKITVENKPKKKSKSSTPKSTRRRSFFVYLFFLAISEISGNFFKI